MTDDSVTFTAYQRFIYNKSHAPAMSGFTPTYVPDWLFDFQAFLLEWAVRKGRGAVLADCGLGKGPISLVWAHNVVRETNKSVLILTPVAVGAQFLTEARKFDIPNVRRSRDGGDFGGAEIIVTNYEKLHLFAPSDFAGLDRVLPFREAREDDSERHVHPLQLDVIDRAIVMWSNHGERILTPFMGVGSEVYSAVRNGRKGLGMELKRSYYQQAVKNVAQALLERDKEQAPLFSLEQNPDMRYEADLAEEAV